MSERGFSTRAQRADLFAEWVYADIRSMGFTLSANGIESRHPDFKAVSRNSTDKTSLSIRFAPDRIGWISRPNGKPRSFYLDAKAGVTIERFAWEQYRMLSDAGCIVALVFKVGNDWCWNVQPEISLCPAEVTLAQFPPEKRFPVRDGWIAPRLAAHWTQTKQTATQASGTPYREVDMSCLLPRSEFRRTMLAILTNQTTED